MSLLSPSESNAFQSFLSTIDYQDEAISASDWAIYNSSAAMHQVPDDPLLDNGVNPGHREALAKATKDLMSLDSDVWGTGGSSMMDHHPNLSHQAFDMQGRHNGHYDHQLLAHQQQVLQHQHQQHPQRHNSFSTNRDLFPFLHNKVQQQQQQQQPMSLQYSSHMQQQHPQMSSLNHSSSSTSFGFQQRHNSISMTPPLHHQQQQPQQQQQQVNIPQQPQRPGSRGTRLPGSGSAPSLSGSSRPSTSAPNGNDASTSAIGARSNSADATGTSKRARTSTSPPISNRTGQPQQKPTLLSPSQKKANHIQSEQKRRANIRRGYEALCETVPALREAIREEEEQEKMSNGGSGTRKKARTKKGAKDGDERDKDRLDGRAGPRSENVVLSKTIDHIQQLISDRSSLLARLHRARSSLPPGHPVLTPLIADPPWEREWKGGEGRLGDEEPAGSDEEEEEAE